MSLVMTKSGEKPASAGITLLRRRRMEKNYGLAIIAITQVTNAGMRHGLSFSFVEYEAIRQIFKYLNGNVDTITRNTVKKVCLGRHEELKGKLKNALKMLPGRISLTCDTWTACTGKGFLCVTAHFIDESWKLCSKLLCFRHVPPPHGGYELSVEIGNILFDWDIQKKVFSLTCDNASNMVLMIKKLKDGILHKDLVCDGEYFHIRCCAHILNLIVQNGLKVIQKSIEKLREGIKYIDGSEARFKRFYDMAKRCSDVSFSGGLWLDVATRWNSTYMMLDRALKYRSVLIAYFDDSNHEFFKYQLGDYEWKKIGEICLLLKPFYDMTTLFSGSDYPTANLYLPQVFLIHKRLQDPIVALDTPNDLVSAISLMIEKFNKYWSEYVSILAIAVVFDPRYKFKFVEYSFRGTYGVVEGERMAREVKLRLEKLFKEYEGIAGIYNSSSVERLGVETPLQYDSIEEFESLGELSSSKSELDKYLEEELMKMTPKYNVLDYWKAHSIQYPVLATMARDLLAIPITSVASESTFSMGGRIISKCRSALTNQNVEALVTVQNWLIGYDDFILEGSSITRPGESGNQAQ